MWFSCRALLYLADHILHFWNGKAGDKSLCVFSFVYYAAVCLECIKREDWYFVIAVIRVATTCPEPFQQQGLRHKTKTRNKT